MHDRVPQMWSLARVVTASKYSLGPDVFFRVHTVSTGQKGSFLNAGSVALAAKFFASAVVLMKVHGIRAPNLDSTLQFGPSTFSI